MGGVARRRGAVQCSLGTITVRYQKLVESREVNSKILQQNPKLFSSVILTFQSFNIMSLTNASPADAAKAAKLASHSLSTLPTSARNDALTAIHSALSQSKDEILAANARDLTLASEAASNGKLSLSIVSRLDLGKKGKWEDMLKGILDVRELEDPGMPPHTISIRRANIVLHSGKSLAADKTRRWIISRKSFLSHWSSSHHFRGSS